LLLASYGLPVVVVLIVTAAISGRMTALSGVFALKALNVHIPFLAALGIITLAIQLMFRDFISPSWSTGFTMVVLVVAGMILVSRTITGGESVGNVIVDRLLSGFLPLRGSSSFATGLCLSFLAIAQGTWRAGKIGASNAFASVALTLSGAALLGYLYSVPDLQSVFLFSSISLFVSVSMFLLGISTILVDCRAGWGGLIASARAGGGPTRRQLAFCLVPILVGFVLLRSIESTAISVNAAIALLVITTLVPLIALVLRDGQILNDGDVARAEHDGYRQRTATELQDKLDRQAAALHQEVKDRLAAEQAMYRAQRMEAVGQLTGGIAHDFNNLLMTIKSNLHLLSVALAPNDPGRSYVDRLGVATDRGASLTGQLLAFSRTQKLDVRPVNLSAALIGARDLIGNALGPNVQIEVSSGREDIWVRTDDNQFQLAILNLAINARDAMPDGGSLRISTSASIVDMVDGKAKQYVAIHVADNGQGMTLEVAARAIEPFYTTKEHGKGTGLGLAQVYGVIKQCGGELRIASEVGHGTTIDILLPPSAAPTVVSATSSVTNRVTRPVYAEIAPLLLIDDDDLVRTAVAEVLRCDGYDVVEAHDGQAALAVLETLTPSAALIDFLMPGMNGAQVAQAARAQLPGLPIIFVSGYSDTIALDEISGAVVLRKPVSPSQLLDTVATVVNLRNTVPFSQSGRSQAS
jgi:signal transduction histidine kinase/CheY-like chemotaxis protein